MLKSVTAGLGHRLAALLHLEEKLSHSSDSPLPIFQRIWAPTAPNGWLPIDIKRCKVACLIPCKVNCAGLVCRRVAEREGFHGRGVCRSCPCPQSQKEKKKISQIKPSHGSKPIVGSHPNSPFSLKVILASTLLWKPCLGHYISENKSPPPLICIKRGNVMFYKSEGAVGSSIELDFPNCCECWQPLSSAFSKGSYSIKEDANECTCWSSS